MSVSDDLYNKILKALKAQTDEIKADIQNLNLQISKEAAITREKINILEAEQRKVKENVLKLDRITRKNNIIIFGINVDESDLISTVINSLNKLLDIHLRESDINDIYKLNKKRDSPIKVEFISYLKKKLIFNSIHKLKGKKIYINNDLCEEDRKTYKILRAHKKQAQLKGYNAHIKKGKLVINNDIFTIDQLEKNHTEETELNPQSPTELYDVQPTVNAPSTPTPISRKNEFEREYINDKTSQSLTINKNNKTLPINTDKNIRKTRSASTTIENRSSTKTSESK